MKIAKITFRIFKILVVVFSLAYIAAKLWYEKKHGVFLQPIVFSAYNFSVLVFVFMLMGANWFTESIKFKLLLKPIQNIKPILSLKSVLAGISVSIFTPKRIGDFGGRIFVLKTENRVNGIFATLLGSYAQLIVTLTIGVICFPLFWASSANTWSYMNQTTVLILLITVVVLSFLVYLNIAKASLYLLKFKVLRKNKQFIAYIQNYQKLDLLKILLMSLIRYAIFSFQWFLLLQFFGVHINYTNAFVGISQIYLYMTFFPTIALGELGVRGSLGVWVLGTYSSAVSGIIAASAMLWIINLALPALIGSYFLSRFKY